MTENKNRIWINAFGNLFARGFNFSPRALRLFGALGNAPINSHRTLQHNLSRFFGICKPHQPLHNQSLQKSCFLALAPTDIFIFGTFIKQT
jgi:hypothetical protein